MPAVSWWIFDENDSSFSLGFAEPFNSNNITVQQGDDSVMGMTPAAETSPLVIHCFNHCGSPNSCQPWQSLTHHCLLRALAPFVLFGTRSQTLCTIEIVGPALYGVGKMQHGGLNWCQNLYLVIPRSLEMALSYLLSSCTTAPLAEDWRAFRCVYLLLPCSNCTVPTKWAAEKEDKRQRSDTRTGCELTLSHSNSFKADVELVLWVIGMVTRQQVASFESLERYQAEFH